VEHPVPTSRQPREAAADAAAVAFRRCPALQHRRRVVRLQRPEPLRVRVAVDAVAERPVPPAQAAVVAARRELHAAERREGLRPAVEVVEAADVARLRPILNRSSARLSIPARKWRPNTASIRS
jgi:hypothetical protein